MLKSLSMRAGLLLTLTMLAGCATHTPEIASGTLTVSGKPAACLSLAQITPNRGKPKELGPITTEEMAALLDRDHPVERMRNLVGDNSSTLTQIDKNNASLTTLCGK